MDDFSASTYADSSHSSLTSEMLLEMYRKIRSSKPKESIEAVLITEILSGYWKARHEGKLYLIIGTMEWVRVQSISVAMQPDPVGLLANTLFGIPVIENEELVRAICGDALEWFRKQILIELIEPFTYLPGS